LGNKTDNDESSSNGGITEEDKNLLRELFKEKSDNKNTKYDID
jgi:hypothetical protein